MGPTIEHLALLANLVNSAHLAEFEILANLRRLTNFCNDLEFGQIRGFRQVGQGGADWQWLARSAEFSDSANLARVAPLAPT